MICPEVVFMSEEAVVEAVVKPKRKRRTKAEMEAARAALLKKKVKRPVGRPPKRTEPLPEVASGEPGEFFEAVVVCSSLPNQRLCYVKRLVGDGLSEQVLCRRKPDCFRVGQKVVVRVVDGDMPEVIRPA